MKHYYRVSSVTVLPDGEFVDYCSHAHTCKDYETALGLMKQHCEWSDFLHDHGDDVSDTDFLAHATWIDDEGIEYDFRLFREEFDV